MMQLHDGRIVIADLTYLGLTNDTLVVSISFVLLAGMIAAILYEVTRHITWRLMRLQKEVESIGAGSLSSRVTVDGSDEIAKLAQSFNKSTETIEDLMNKQRMLLTNASHELCTPLARIQMAIELLNTNDTPKRRSDLTRDITELNLLIDDLIAMTRFDTDGDVTTFEPVDLIAVAFEESSRFEDCSVQGTEAEVMGDARMLQHLVRNLLENAQKYGRPPIEIKIEECDKQVMLTVTDGGPGIPVAERHKVFEPFYRGAGHQNILGYGLGLPLVARIAKAHGANVRIEDFVGSAVSVAFPI